MKLEEAIKVYQECHSNNANDCKSCPIGKRDYSYQLTVCNHLAIAEEQSSGIETECKQDDCQERNNKNACCDCAGVSGYKSPQEKEI